MAKNSSNQWVLGLIAALLAAIVLVGVYIAYLLLSKPDEGNRGLVDISDYNQGITVIEPARPMPDFTLSDQSGASIQLSDLGGKPILLAFGYTHCPDVCPLTLGNMRDIHDLLGAQADAIHFLFISVDGSRDTPQVLQEYFQTLRVDSFMIGMTGAEDNLHEITTSYSAQFSYGEPDEFGNYEVDHTAGMFLLDANRNWIRRYTFGTEPERIAEDLQAAI